MDPPSRVEELLARAVDEQVGQQRAWRDSMDELAQRVAALEASVESLRADLSGAVQTAAREAIAGELDDVAGELSRRVSELGRMIVRDLGRLQQVLESHRAAIIQEIRPWVMAASTHPRDVPQPARPVPEPAAPSVDVEREAAIEQEIQALEEEAGSPEQDPRRRRRLRRE
jgi:hypothetical protein